MPSSETPWLWEQIISVEVPKPVIVPMVAAMRVRRAIEKISTD